MVALAIVIEQVLDRLKSRGPYRQRGFEISRSDRTAHMEVAVLISEGMPSRGCCVTGRRLVPWRPRLQRDLSANQRCHPMIGQGGRVNKCKTVRADGSVEPLVDVAGGAQVAIAGYAQKPRAAVKTDSCSKGDNSDGLTHLKAMLQPLTSGSSVS